MEKDKQEEVSLRLGVWRYMPPIPCPICGKPTVSTWDTKYRNELGHLLILRGCIKCEKVFSPEPELKWLPELSLVDCG